MHFRHTNWQHVDSKWNIGGDMYCKEFSFRGTILAQGSGDRSSQWGPGTRPPEAEAVCRHCLQILTAETIKIGKFPHSWLLSFLTILCHGWGVSDILWGLAPQAVAWRRHCEQLRCYKMCEFREFWVCLGESIYLKVPLMCWAGTEGGARCNPCETIILQFLPFLPERD